MLAHRYREPALHTEDDFPAGEQDVVHNSTSEIVVINITEGLKDRLQVRKYRADEIWTE